jgi:excinuclease UvrABC nuclease subunit
MQLSCHLPVAADRQLDFETVPDIGGVFLLRFAEGRPYLGRTAFLRRRLKRMLQPRAEGSRLANLAAAVHEVSYQPTGSSFESALVLYELAREHLAGDYRRYMKLRNPPLVKVHLGNRFPRTYVTAQLTRRRASFIGPFLNRASAERFESAFLDLFLIRRCQEDLDPHPAHPGCIYGEMEMCLRPCQARANDGEYQAEVGRVLDFLGTQGQSLVREIQQARDAASAALEFEEAARLHKRLDKVHETLKLKDDLARDLDALFAVVVQRSVQPESVDLWFVNQGFFQPKITFCFGVEDGRSISLDRRLREALADVRFSTGSTQERADHLALLRRWYYSSFRDGEIVMIDRLDRISYRKLVNAVSRVAAGRTIGAKSVDPGERGSTGPQENRPLRK